MAKLAARKSTSAKKLLAEHQLPMDASTLHNGLTLAGAIEVVSYNSTSGSGEIKSFFRFTDTGLVFGANAINPFHAFKTELKFYADAFPAAYRRAINGIAQHALQRFPDTTTPS